MRSGLNIGDSYIYQKEEFSRSSPKLRRADNAGRDVGGLDGCSVCGNTDKIGQMIASFLKNGTLPFLPPSVRD